MVYGFTNLCEAKGLGVLVGVGVVFSSLFVKLYARLFTSCVTCCKFVDFVINFFLWGACGDFLYDFFISLYYVGAVFSGLS